MPKKEWRVGAHCGWIPSAHAFQEVQVTAGTLPAAVARALREIVKRKGWKGRRVSRVEITVDRVGTGRPILKPHDRENCTHPDCKAELRHTKSEVKHDT